MAAARFTGSTYAVRARVQPKMPFFAVAKAAHHFQQRELSRCPLSDVVVAAEWRLGASTPMTSVEAPGRIDPEFAQRM